MEQIDICTEQAYACGCLEPTPWTLSIVNCKQVVFSVNGIEVTADLGKVNFDEIDHIEINGHRYKKCDN
jgi:hypothetical protein